MTDRDTCRRPTCTNDPRGRDADGVTDRFSARFCSPGCELKFEHVRGDAREAPEPRPEEI